MPIYDYKCDSCSTEFETLICHSDDKPSCPGCGSEKATRIVAKKMSFQLKGSGWARDNYSTIKDKASLV